MAYTANVPQANQQISATQAPILGNFQFLSTGIGTEHNFNAAGSGSDMYHKQASMPNRSGGDPVALPAGTNGMWYVNNQGGRFYDGTTVCKLTEGSAAASGYQWIGKVLLQWGVSAVLGAVTFPIAFPTACFNVQVTPGVSGATTATVNICPTSIIAAGFSIIRAAGTSTGFGPYYWLAIGN